MGPVGSELDAAARVLAGRALLRRAAETLATVGTVPVVLKGVLISALSEGRGEPPRPALDVDVLVEAELRAAAEQAVERAGFVPLAQTPTATNFRDPDLGIDLDLHVALVDAGLFRLDPARFLARARVDRALFGFPVRIPKGEDIYAHLVAHFARNRSGARDQRRLRDFAIVAQALPLEPRKVAEHLAELGLGRASRYALGLAVEAGDPFAARVLQALPSDPLGDALARAARGWLARVPGRSAWAVPALHLLLNHSLAAGMTSLAWHAGRAARSRMLLFSKLEGPQQVR